MEEITGIGVVYNTKDLLQRAIESIRKYYPEMKLVIVNGSDLQSECTASVRSYTNAISFNVGYNIGHGKGMDYALERCGTSKALIFDSDIVLKKTGVIEKMNLLLKDNYGVGKCVQTDRGGRNIEEEGIKYLHPYFMLINIASYFRHHAFVHHGAPCYKTMNELNDKSMSDILIDFPLEAYVEHNWKGTRNLNPVEFLNGWE